MKPAYHLLLALTLSASALGHALWPTTASANDGDRDIVLLRDGDTSRGVIVESVPERYLLLLTPDGELERHAMEDVEYAGPAEEAPLPPAGAGVGESGQAAESGEPVRIRVTGREGLGLFLRQRRAFPHRTHGALRAPIGPLCTAPCELTLERGSYLFEIIPPKGSRISHGPWVPLLRDTDLHIDYRRRKGLRASLSIVGAAMIATGIGLFVGSKVAGCRDECGYGLGAQLHKGYLGAGAALSITGIVAFIVGITRRDRATIEATSPIN